MSREQTIPQHHLDKWTSLCPVYIYIYLNFTISQSPAVTCWSAIPSLSLKVNWFTLPTRQTSLSLRAHTPLKPRSTSKSNSRDVPKCHQSLLQGQPPSLPYIHPPPQNIEFITLILYSNRGKIESPKNDDIYHVQWRSHYVRQADIVALVMSQMAPYYSP